MVKLEATAAILAGGNSSRMGTDKALLDWNGRPLLAHVAHRLTGWFASVFIIAGRRDPYRFVGIPIISDETAGLGPLSGIEAALRASAYPTVFVCATDMPFLDEQLIRYLIVQANGPVDAVVPVVHGQYEPLCAVYRTSLLPTVQALLEARDLKVQSLLQRARVSRVEEAAWSRFGPAHRLFFNCNTPADLEAARYSPEPKRPNSQT